MASEDIWESIKKEKIELQKKLEEERTRHMMDALSYVSVSTVLGRGVKGKTLSDR